MTGAVTAAAPHPVAAMDQALQHQVGALYAEHHGWLFSWLQRRLGCGHQAADVAHDTFLRLMGGATHTASLREPRAYLVTTAKRLLIDEARRRRMESAYLDALAALGTEQEAPAAERVAQAVQALLRIQTALERESARLQEAFLLHYLDGQTQPEVAQALGVSVRMVQKYLAQALVRCHLAIGHA